MAVISSALVLMAFGVLGSRDEHPVLTYTVAAAAAIAGIGYGTLWLRRWPTRRQSLMMGMVGGSMIAVGSGMQTEPVVALMGCTGLVVTGGYLAFFHNTKAVLFNFAVAATVGTYCALRVFETYDDRASALAGLWLIIELNLAVPLAIQTVVRTMGADVVRSDHDALTGLLNRRGFYERASSLLTSPAADSDLIVVMIDLDAFKRLNDTYGHLAGDQALAAVGWALRKASPGSAVIGRTGGEEFLLIDILPVAQAEALPDELCAAIAALPHPVTASVGAAVVRGLPQSDAPAVIEALTRTADATMYEAKRSGGNQALIRRVSPLFQN
ncbi:MULTISPECIES: GGDEF domain-containing protein [Mycolicibacterium]|nr:MULTISPECIES: GGDEF domain-containing protein [Mycolicibacterium]STZ45769.1 diguanylate cyclase [Mycolicibacterium gilvum]